VLAGLRSDRCSLVSSNVVVLGRAASPQRRSRHDPGSALRATQRSRPGISLGQSPVNAKAGSGPRATHACPPRVE
jgi:hypothetical protein